MAKKGKEPKAKTLTAQQEQFCREYIVDFNASAAAERANYSGKTKGQVGWQLLQKPLIQERVRQLAAERAKKTDTTVERILEELARMAFADINDLFDEKGDLKPISQIPEDLRRAISSVEIEALYDGFGKDRYQIGHTKKIKFWSKEKTLELLGKYRKMFTDRIEHTGKVSLVDLVAGAAEDDEEAE